MNEQLWDAFVTGHPKGTILQASRWGRLKASFDWRWELVTQKGVGRRPHPTEAHEGVRQRETGYSPSRDTIESGALVLYRPLLRGLAGTMAYVPRGPVVNWENAHHVAALMDAIAHAARQQRAWALWLDPALLDTPEARAQLRNLGFTPAGRVIQPPRTIVIDISVNEEEILARMKQKTRYNIRLSARRGVTVREGSADEVATFYALMTETGSRDEFGIHSETYYHHALELFSRTQHNPTSQPHIGGEAALLLADVEGETVAGLMVFALGQKAWYFYGASSNRHRSTMPTYALQWAAIRWAKARGCTRYDLWGIPDADEETLEAEFTERSDGLWGVYRFKRGFGGEVIRYVGLWEKALNPLYPFVARLGPYSKSHS